MKATIKRDARIAEKTMGEGVFMVGCLSGFFRTILVRFSDLYQLVRPFVKKNLRSKNINRAVSTAILILLLVAALPQQGQCLTAEEIAYLKNAGVSDETIQLMIQQDSKQRRHSQTGIWEVEDERGNRSTIYRVGDDGDAVESKRAEQEKVDRAWEMLRNIIIDAREKE